MSGGSFEQVIPLKNLDSIIFKTHLHPDKSKFSFAFFVELLDNILCKGDESTRGEVGSAPCVQNRK